MFARFLHDVANTLKVFEVWDFFFLLQNGNCIYNSNK